MNAEFNTCLRYVREMPSKGPFYMAAWRQLAPSGYGGRSVCAEVPPEERRKGFDPLRRQMLFVPGDSHGDLGKKIRKNPARLVQAMGLNDGGRGVEADLTRWVVESAIVRTLKLQRQGSDDEEATEGNWEGFSPRFWKPRDVEWFPVYLEVDAKAVKIGFESRDSCHEEYEVVLPCSTMGPFSFSFQMWLRDGGPEIVVEFPTLDSPDDPTWLVLSEYRGRKLIWRARMCYDVALPSTTEPGECYRWAEIMEFGEL